jgi:hypothetical protein
VFVNPGFEAVALRFFECSRIRPTDNDVSVADGPGAVNQLGLVEAIR